MLDGGNGVVETDAQLSPTEIDDVQLVTGGLSVRSFSVVTLAGDNDVLDVTANNAADTDSGRTPDDALFTTTGDRLGVVYHEGLFATNPLDPDTDGDGLIDGLEKKLASNPNDPSDASDYRDSDNDGLTDAEEREGWPAPGVVTAYEVSLIDWQPADTEADVNVSAMVDWCGGISFNDQGESSGEFTTPSYTYELSLAKELPNGRLVILNPSISGTAERSDFNFNAFTQALGLNFEQIQMADGEVLKLVGIVRELAGPNDVLVAESNAPPSIPADAVVTNPDANTEVTTFTTGGLKFTRTVTTSTDTNGDPVTTTVWRATDLEDVWEVNHFIELDSTQAKGPEDSCFFDAAINYSIAAKPVSNVTSDPYEPDSDFDGLPDLLEAFLASDPRNRDSDSDGLLDFDEFSSDSKHSMDLIAFRDFEDICLTAPRCVFDPEGSLSYGTNVIKWDTDDDGLSDRDEIFESWLVTAKIDGVQQAPYLVQSSAVNSDTDFDGLNDREEQAAKTDPSNADTDADGELDSYDINPLGYAVKALVRLDSWNVGGDDCDKGLGEQYGDFDYSFKVIVTASDGSESTIFSKSGFTQLGTYESDSYVAPKLQIDFNESVPFDLETDSGLKITGSIREKAINAEVDEGATWTIHKVIDWKVESGEIIVPPGSGCFGDDTLRFFLSTGSQVAAEEPTP
jgi:hypothetical protein